MKANATKPDINQIITERLISALESGVAPWRKPWKDGNANPSNLASGKKYNGINFFLLSCSPFGDSRWLTYKQAQGLGGNVRKGETGTPVVFWNWIEKEKNGKAEKIPFLKYYTVFNAEQCEGLPEAEKPESVIDFVPHEAAQSVIEKTGASMNHGGGRAYYRPSADQITMPRPETFESVDAYYHTAFHELAHWTGHASRLNREGITASAAFGSAVYSREELIAEMASCFVAAQVGISPEIDNSAAYLKGWIAALRGDSKLAIKAASAANKAAAFIMGIQAGKEDA